MLVIFSFLPKIPVYFLYNDWMFTVFFVQFLDDLKLLDLKCQCIMYFNQVINLLICSFNMFKYNPGIGACTFLCLVKITRSVVPRYQTILIQLNIQKMNADGILLFIALDQLGIIYLKYIHVNNKQYQPCIYFNLLKIMYINADTDPRGTRNFHEDSSLST